jgi:hypothetical protein
MGQVIEPTRGDSIGSGPAGTGGRRGGDRPTAMGGPTQPDRQLLIDFLLDLEDELTDVSGLLRESFPAFERGLTGLHANVDLAIAQLQQEAIAGLLAASELRGAQLRMKIAARDAARALEGAIRRGGTIFAGATKISLKAANMLLGSMLKLPGIEGVKEFKDAVEIGLDVVTYLSGSGGGAESQEA